MSVVAVKKYKNRIVLGCDSQISTNGGNKLLVDDKNIEFCKIIKTNGLIIGLVGIPTDMSYMRMYAKTHKPKSTREEDMLEWFVEYVEWCRKKDKDYSPSKSRFIAIYRKEVYMIDGDFEIRKIKDYYAMGSGGFLALGALFYDKTIKQAIRVAKEFDLYCGGETKIITRKNGINIK